MLSCPKLIAEFDRLAQLCRDADANILACCRGEIRGSLWHHQHARDKAEEQYFKFREEHDVAACLSRHPGH